jgi:Protein of unknown function (DUF4229)
VRGPGPFLVYTALRVGVFAVTLAVLYLLGMRQLLLLVVALLVSGLLSFVLLSRHRDAMSTAVTERGSSLRRRMREATEAEDAADDAMRAAEQPEAEQPEAEQPGAGDRGVAGRGARSAQRESEPDQDGER